MELYNEKSHLSRQGRSTGAVKKSRADHSLEVDNLRFFNLVQPSPKPFYTPQYHNPLPHQRKRTPNRHSLLNTIATPSRNSSILPERHKVSLSPEKAENSKNQEIFSGRTPKSNGTGTPKKTSGKEKLHVRGKSRQDVDVLINSLLIDDEEIQDSCDDVTGDDDDVIVIGFKEAEKNLIDRVSPTTLALSKAAVSEIHPTTTVYTKFQLKSSEKKLSEIREEKRASAAAVVELFNDDSSEEDDEPVQRNRPTPKMITKTRKEMVPVARDPLIGVAPKIMRRVAVMKDPLVRVSPMLRRNGVATVEKRKLKSDQMKTKGGGMTPRLIKDMRNEEPVIDDPLIGVNAEEERSEEPATKKRKFRSDCCRIQASVEDEEVTPELIKETREDIRREKATTEKKILRSDRSKVRTTIKDDGVTSRVIKEARKEEAVMEDQLAVISPKRRKLRSSQRKPPTYCREIPELIKEVRNKEPVMDDPLARLSPPMEKRKCKSRRNKTPSTNETTPSTIKEVVQDAILDGEPSDLFVELREEEPEKRRLRSSCRELPATSEHGGVAPGLMKEMRKEEPVIEDGPDGESSELVVDLREEEPVTEKRKIRRRSSRREPPDTSEDGGVVPGLIKEMGKEKSRTKMKRTLRNRNPTTCEENVLPAVNQLAPEKKNASNPRITSIRQARKKNKEKESVTKPSTRRSTRTATARSSENDKTYTHDSRDGLSSESEWNTTDEDDNDEFSSGEEEIEIEVTKKRRPPLKPINTVMSKSRKRPSPVPPRSGADGYTNKRPKLSLSSKRSEKAKKLQKVRTIEKKRVSTPAVRRIATPSRRKILTPHIPQRKKVTFGKSTTGSRTNQFEAARERLHVSALPETIPCRENEFLEICNYVEGKLQDETGGCMYISGVPGTGKTATVREVGRYLKQSCEEGELPEFKFVEINGMRLTEPHRAYVSILKQLTGEDATPDHASLLLDRYFSSTDNDKLPTVLLADELDLLWTRKQTVLYNLFDWPTRQHAKLIVLAVANTMDLPEKVMMNKVASRLGLTRLTFQPYTFQQLQEIVTSRMTGLKVFEPDAIQLAARKVAAVSGDARRALDIARRATEIAHLEKGVGLVGIPHIDRAVQEMFSSAKIQAIRHASLHEKMFLKAVLAEFRRSGLEEANFKGVHQQLDAIYKTEDMHPANLTELHGICCQLGVCRLLLVERGRLNIHTRIRLNISQDDVLFALRTC